MHKMMNESKGKKSMRPEEQKAKLDVLHDLRGEAMKMMKEGLGHAKGLKKVTVASDSEEGLKEGLEKAENVIEGKLGEQDGEDEYKETDGFSEEGESTEEAMSEDEIEKKIQELMAMKAKLKG